MHSSGDKEFVILILCSGYWVWISKSPFQPWRRLSQLPHTYYKSRSFWCISWAVQFLVMAMIRNMSCSQQAFLWGFYKKGKAKYLVWPLMPRIYSFPVGVWENICPASTVGCVHCAPWFPCQKVGSCIFLLDHCLFAPLSHCRWRVSSLAQCDKMLNSCWV